MDQRELVERARRGDHDAFATLAGAAIARLDAVASLILRDRDLARDAVQEALVRAWRDLPGLRDAERFDAWLRRLTVRACVDDLRRRRARVREVELPGAEVPDRCDSTHVVADRDELARGFRRLEPEQRALIVLHYYLGLSLPEAADSLGLPLGTAKSRLHRAVQALRAAIEADARLTPSLEGGRLA